MELWTITEAGARVANDFYFTREEAEAALAEAQRDTSHPEDAAMVALLRVERIRLDADASPN